MKTLFSILIFTLYLSSSSAQNIIVYDFNRVDSVMDQIPDTLCNSTANLATYVEQKFSADNEKLRAIFYWVSNNISYDVVKMNKKEIIIENDDDNIAATLKLRKGVCYDYATLFNDLCSRVGLQSLIVEGYVIKSNSLNYFSHAWNTVYIDGAWYLFDATWAAGYVKRDKFVKELKNEYYKAKPKELFATHIPYNYLFQFSNTPVSHEELVDGNKNATLALPKYAYLDSIKKYQSESRFYRNISEYNCIKNYKGKNTEIRSRANQLQLSIEVDKSNMVVFAYNAAVLDYNEGIKAYNKFINYRNNKLMPTKPDKEIQGMLTAVRINFDDAKEKLTSIKTKDSKFENLVSTQLNKVIVAQKLVKEQQDWLTLYLSKSTKDRKWMFYQR